MEMGNIAIVPQVWPAISYEAGLQIIRQQYKYVVLFNTNRGPMVCVGNTEAELSDDIQASQQYCNQNNIIILK